MFAPPLTIEQLQTKILNRTVDNSSCWEWSGAKSTAGYGYWSEGLHKPMWRVHRLIWALTHNEPMPRTKQAMTVIDHICNNKLCFRPSHLQKISQRENVRRNPKHDGTHYDYHQPTHDVKEGDLYLYKTTKYGKYYRCRPCFNEYCRNRRKAGLDKRARGLHR